MTAFEADEHATARRPGVDRRVIGLVLIGVGILWFAQTTNIVSVSGETLLALMLMLLGGGLLLTARCSQRLVAPVALGLALTLALVGHSKSFSLRPLPRFGTLQVRAAKAADVLPEYHDAMGNLVLDLSQLPPAALNRDVNLRSGIGSVRVLVPPGVDVEVDGKVGAGSLTVCGVPVSTGLGQDEKYDNDLPGAFAHLRLRITEGLGSVAVEGCRPASGTEGGTP